VRDVALHGTDIHALIDPAEQSPEGLARHLRQLGVPVHEVTPVESTLEDVFISLISTAPDRSSAHA
jgi:hypothetical protein